MRKLISFLTLLLVFISNGFSQYTFERSTPDSRVNFNNPVLPTSDGGFLLIQSDYINYNYHDTELTKFDSLGNVQWSKKYVTGAMGVNCGVETLDSAYLFVGYLKESWEQYNNMFLIKTDLQGNILWTKTIGPPGACAGYKILKTWDGGYVIGGLSIQYGPGTNAYYMVKVDANGSPVWGRTYGYLATDQLRTMVVTKDKGFLMAGYTNSFGGHQNPLLVKTDSLGNILWAKHYQNNTQSLLLYDAIETVEGDILVSGGKLSFSTSFGTYLMRVNSLGNIKWANYYSSNSKYVAFTNLSSIGINQIVGSASVFDHDGINSFNYRGAFVKLDSIGNISHAIQYTGLLESSIAAYPTGDSRFHAIGWKSNATSSSHSVFKLDSMGRGACQTANISISKTPLSLVAVTAPVFGGFALTDSIDNRVVVTSINKNYTTDCISTSVMDVYHQPDFFLYPNPGDGLYRIISNSNYEDADLSIYSSHGTLVLSKKYSVTEQVEFDIRSCKPGMYLVMLTTGNLRRSMKLIKN